MVKEICERCGKAYEAGPNTHYCKECRKEIRSVAAKNKFSEHGNVTHWMYYPAAPKD